MFGFLLLLHILGATIWTGGHIVLAFVVLPRILKEKSPEELLKFESVFEKIGMPALIIQIVTGVSLAYQKAPDFMLWLDFSNPLIHVIWLKLTLLLVTFCFALSARFRVVPKLSDPKLGKEILPLMAWHIIPVTIISILFVVVGVSFRTGWFY
ncbi:CopD family protein [Vibrio lamellibrachiae]|uniref:CopD family protein n=1 Tax=Vibrio lamellibrachiae TaxID=2910253 RepID=UPI003D0E97B9